MKCKPHKSVFVKCTLCVYVHMLSGFISFYKAKDKMPCYCWCDKHNWTSVQWYKSSYDLIRCWNLPHFLCIFSMLTKEYDFFFFFFFLWMNSEVIYGTRTTQKKTNPRSGKVISSCEAMHTGLHLNGIWNVHPKI